MQEPDVTGPDRATLVAFAVAVLIGGTNFIAVKFSNEELPPLFGAALRFTAASALFFVWMFIRRLPVPRGRAAIGAALYGLLGFGVSYALLYYALIGLSAGMSSVIIASTPLATLVLAVLHGQERFSVRGVIGGTLAIAGIGLLSTGVSATEVRPIYFFSALLGTFAIAESSVLVKSFPRTDPITTNAIGMAAGALLLVVGSVLFGETWALPQETATWAALGWLIVLGSVGLFYLFLFVIARWKASATVYVVTLMPVVAVVLGVVILNEKLSIELLAGAALVFTAVYIGALSKEKAPPRPVAEPIGS